MSLPGFPVTGPPLEREGTVNQILCRGREAAIYSGHPARPHRTQSHRSLRLCRQYPGKQHSGGAWRNSRRPAQHPGPVHRHEGQRREYGVYRGRGGYLSDFLPCEYHPGLADGDPAGNQRGEPCPLYHQSGGIHLRLFAAIVRTAIPVGGGAGASLTIIRLDGTGVADGTQTDPGEHGADTKIEDE